MRTISRMVFVLFLLAACAAPSPNVTVTSEVTVMFTPTPTPEPSATPTRPTAPQIEMMMGLPTTPDDKNLPILHCDQIIETPEVGGDWTKIARATSKYALSHLLPWKANGDGEISKATDINIKLFKGNLQALTFISSDHVEKSSDLEVQYFVVGCDTKESKYLPKEFTSLTDRVYFVTTVIPAEDGGNLAFTSAISQEAYESKFTELFLNSQGVDRENNLMPIYNVGNAKKGKWFDSFGIDLGLIPVKTTVKVPKDGKMVEMPFEGDMLGLMGVVEDVIGTAINGKYHVELSEVGSEAMQEYINESFTSMGWFYDALSFNDEGKK